MDDSDSFASGPWSKFLPENEPVHPAKVVRVLMPDGGEPDCGSPVAFVGFAAIPVYRQADLHPFMVSYQPAQIGMPAGCLVIGSKIDVIAMAWTCSLTATDRALLEGMRITPNFVPSEAKVTEPERK